MKKSSRKRTLFYRRASWSDGVGKHLEALLRNAHQTLKTTSERTFSYSEGNIVGLYVDESHKGALFCHVVYYIPNQPTSLVPEPSTKAKITDTVEQQPPDKHHFMEADIFFLVSDNDVVVCPSSGARESVMLSYVSFLLEKIGQGAENYLKLSPVANVDQIKLLKKEGVRRLLLNASLYEASVGYLTRKTTKNSLFHGVIESFEALFQHDQDRELQRITDKENLSVKLEIGFDSRRGEGRLEKKRLLETAEKMLTEHENDGFVIITGTNKRITADEVRLSKKVVLEADGKSVARDDAFRVLEEYLKELKLNGMLGQ